MKKSFYLLMSITILNTYLYANNLKWFPMPSGNGLVVVIPIAQILPSAEVEKLFVGKTYYLNENGNVSTLVFGTDNILIISFLDENKQMQQEAFPYSIIGDTLSIAQNGEDEILSNFQIVEKGLGFIRADGSEGGFYFTYADAEADIYNDNGNNNTHVDNELTVSISINGNTLTAIFNKEMNNENFHTEGQYSPASSYWTDKYTFVIDFDSYTKGGTITLIADGFVSIVGGIMAMDVVFTFPE